MKDEPVIEDGFVEIEGGTIVAVGSKGELAGNSREVMETSGTILPGLINSHAHLAWDGIHDLADQSIHDLPEISAYKCATNMLVSLRSGITTVRDLGMNKTSVFAKQAVEQGWFAGPRVLICAEAIVQTGGHTYWCCREATGADEMRRAVREQVQYGADLIKIMACHDTLEFTDAELEAVLDEAHKSNLYVTAHATYDEAIARVARFGIDCIEHGGKMSDETIDLLVSKNIPIVTTFSPLVMQSRPEVARKYNIPEWKIEETYKGHCGQDPLRQPGESGAGRGANRFRYRCRKPGRAAQRRGAGDGVHDQARCRQRQLRGDHERHPRGRHRQPDRLQNGHARSRQRSGHHCRRWKSN